MYQFPQKDLCTVIFKLFDIDSFVHPLWYHDLLAFECS